MMRVLILLLALAACAPTRTAWDGKRGYDGAGDYGYEPGRTPRTAQTYPVPGPPEDPWGPHIREAAGRFAVPEEWVRAVMRQESGGQDTAVSSAGAMGLMQVMPATYDQLRRRHSLGSDPFEPRDNILAGTAYLREMHARFGAPAFLAAYNAGPDRVESYLAGNTMLPDETVNYVAAIGPRIGLPGSFGPAADGRVFTQAPATGQDAAFAGGGMTGAEYATLRR